MDRRDFHPAWNKLAHARRVAWLAFHGVSIIQGAFFRRRGQRREVNASAGPHPGQLRSRGVRG